MVTKRKNQTIEYTIDELTKRGNGKGPGRFSNDTSFPIETPFAIPGDHVRAKVIRKRKGTYLSKLEEIVVPSSDRQDPRCNHFGTCGGCRWQQLSYEKQLQIKDDIIKESFSQLINQNSRLLPIIGCQSPWHYRNKMEFSFSTNAANQKFLGLIIDSSKGKVFNLTECHLVNPWFVETITAVRKWWDKSNLDAYHPYSNKGSLRTLIVREGIRSGDRMIMLTVSGNPDYALQKVHLEHFVACLREAIEPADPNIKLSIFLRIHQAVKGIPTHFYEMHLYGSDYIRETMHINIENDKQTLTFNISPAAFFQPNTLQAEKLYSTALTLAEIPKHAIVYDLYCGTGTLGICIAKRAKQVIAIEISPEAAYDARYNAAQNGLDNITVITGAVRHTLLQMHSENRFPPPDIILVDPPRPGLDPQALKSLIEVKPPKILYLSCNPATQVENIAELIKNGYMIKTVQPIDQFPHTVHIENIVVLERC